jgi:ribosomal protein S18 acetylase RimI-like enzyme
METDCLRLEELQANAWPSFSTMLVGGWIVRFAEGYTRRANSATPLYGGSGANPDWRLIEGIAERYRVHGLRACFRLPEPLASNGLASGLESRGFAREAPTVVMAKELAENQGARGSSDPEFDSCERFTKEWVGAVSRMQGREGVEDKLSRVLEAIAPECRYAAMRVGGVIAAAGLLVVEDGWAGVFDVVVDPKRRGKGLGRRLMRGLLDTASSIGASKSYLQVMEDNGPALALYESLGYEPAYRYAYYAEPCSHERG